MVEHWGRTACFCWRKSPAGMVCTSSGLTTDDALQREGVQGVLHEGRSRGLGKRENLA
jgi:hypothetical protein